MVFIPRAILVALLLCVNLTTGWAAEDMLFPTQFRTEATKFMTGKCDKSKTKIAFYRHKEYQLVEVVSPKQNKYFLVQVKGKFHVFLRYSSWFDKSRIPEEWIATGWILDLEYESPNFLNMILKKGISNPYYNQFEKNYLENLFEMPTLDTSKKNSDCRLISVK